MSSRAERRRQQRETPPAPGRRAGAPHRRLPGIGRPEQWLPPAAGGLLAIAILAVTGRFLQLQITWYLAVDQFGYLTFARDLLRGRVLHEWPLGAALGTAIPNPTDILAQTYVWTGADAYCRYGIGFPLVLAAWLRLFGEGFVHYLNPLVFLCGLALLAAFEHRASRSAWRAIVCMTIPLICRQTNLYLWSLTLTRDMLAHVTALLGLFLLLPVPGQPLTRRRAALGFLPLGFALAIRPDAQLYLPSAAFLVLWRRHRQGAPQGLLAIAGAALGGYLAGALPFFVYNTIAVGNPLLSTQSMELRRLWSGIGELLAPSAWAVGWHGGTGEPVQGGGLRLAHFPATFPAMLRFIVAAYGQVLAGAALLGAGVALVRRRVVFVVAVPYVIAALVFFSCWVRVDHRYLVGVWFLLPVLVVEGTLGGLDLIRWLARRQPELAGRTAALALALAVAVLSPASYRQASAGGHFASGTAIVATIVGGAALAALAWPRRRIVMVAAPLLAICLAANVTVRTYAGLPLRASFQRPEAERARATLRAALSANAVVISTEDVGRPAENIEHYAGIPALYTTDLARWRMPAGKAIALLLFRGLRPYFLLPPRGDIDRIRREVEPHVALEEVRDIAPAQAMAYFVAAPFHRGVPLKLWRARFDALENVLSAERGHIP